MKKSTNPKQGLVIWLTGLSASGKTTLSCKFVEKYGHSLQTKILDGDAIRAASPGTGFSKSARLEHLRRVGELAAECEANGHVVIVAVISPYEEARQAARSLCKNFFEVYVSTPLDVCIARDPKGLYKKALANEIKHFTGISDPYEVPQRPDLTINTAVEPIEVSLEKMFILAGLKK